MRRSPLWFAGFSLLTLFAAVDCTSGYVSQGNETCANNQLDKDQGETATDCGGKLCAPCAEGKACQENTDCAEGLSCDTTGKTCLSTHCTNKTKDVDETDKDCGGASCPACGASLVCKANRDCVSTVCKSGLCTGASCTDETQNQGEIDVDCGDPNGLCPPCEAGLKCTDDKGCQSGICNSGTCTEASCSDRIKNGTEGDVDCGGTCSTLCGKGDSCTTDADCKSGVCNEKCLDASCADQVKNGTETAVDCGGTCSPCLEAKDCAVDSDCKSKFCKQGLCVVPTCSDNIQNQGESDVDCGSPASTCAPCGGGKLCTAITDCESGICTEGRCVTSSCTDNKKNGTEGDTDCGGTCPNRCGDGRTCIEMTDCGSGVCSSGLCSPSACNDLVQNGSETDKDCGGGCSAKCDVGQGCKDNSDCKINSCNLGRCENPSCSNNTIDGTETALDCGGASCSACTEGQTCALPRDCVSSRCVNKSCAAAVCGDQVKNGLETDVDCGGDCTKKCADGAGCGGSQDCVSGVCDGGKCQAPACDDKVQNDLETDVDCGGAVCVTAKRTCVNGKRCQVDTDCQSGVCNATTGKCQAQSCNDTRKNQTETDVDCGGACSGCGTGKKCVADNDCADDRCVGGFCAVAKCPDGVKNGGEGDTDCGAVCGTDTGTTLCGVGQTCNNNADCKDGVCVLSGLVSKCASPSCTDKVQNGAESDVDCGVACPTKCAAGSKCGGTADCDTVTILGTECKAGICKAPNCTDNVKSTGETDVDCGGTQCAPCANGKTCLLNSDCDPITSGHCVVDGSAKVCVAATCDDSLVNGAETDKDCGGSNASCFRCADGKACEMGADCSSKVCDNSVCKAASCTDKKQNGTETGLDCGGATCADLGYLCANDLSCAADRDCASGWCDTGTHLCKERTCTDKVKNGTESDVDCGAICPTNKCGLGSGCKTDADCASNACSECTGKCIQPKESCLIPGTANCSQCSIGGACSADFDCESFNCVSGKCAAADNCAGQLLTDANGFFSDNTKICNTSNPSDVPYCKAYLRCFFVKNCNPANPCFTTNDGDCGVNKIGGGTAGQTAAKNSWTKATCTDPSSLASGL